MGLIYGLADPRTDRIRYVGQTHENVLSRYACHLRDERGTAKLAWIKDLQSRNLLPHFVLLEEVDDTLLDEREVYWILFYREKEGDLLNSYMPRKRFILKYNAEQKRMVFASIRDKIIAYIEKVLQTEHRVPGPSECARVLKVAKSYASQVINEYPVDQEKVDPFLGGAN